MNDFGIDVGLARAFVASPVGMTLVDRFPIGTLHRDQFPAFAQWERRYHPEIRKRVSKTRRKKR
jgi:hypothetical protein